MYETWVWPSGMGPLVLQMSVGRSVRCRWRFRRWRKGQLHCRRPVSWPVVIKTEPQVDCVSVELSDRELVTITDVSRDIRCSPDVVPVMLPSHLEVVESPDEGLAGWHLESADMAVTQDAHLRTELCRLKIRLVCRCPCLPVEANTETQVDVRWEPTLVVVPSNEVMGVTGEAQLRTDVCPVISEKLAMEPMSFPVVAIRKRRSMLDGSPLRWWPRQVVEVAVRWDGSILNLTVGWWTRLC